MDKEELWREIREACASEEGYWMESRVWEPIEVEETFGWMPACPVCVSVEKDPDGEVMFCLSSPETDGDGEYYTLEREPVAHVAGGNDTWNAFAAALAAYPT